MKRRFLSLLFVFSLLFSSLLSLSSCGGKVLYQLSDGSRTVQVLGFRKVSALRVTENGSLLWKTAVKTEKSACKDDPTYGLEVFDINFDGKSDIILTLSKNGECKKQTVFLQTDSAYEESSMLKGLHNLMAQEDILSVFAYDSARSAGNIPNTYVLCDTVTQYEWLDGQLTPQKKVELFYYSETDVYCYSVSQYDKENKEFSDSDDDFLSPAEYAETDFGFFYYFRK